MTSWFSGKFRSVPCCCSQTSHAPEYSCHTDHESTRYFEPPMRNIRSLASMLSKALQIPSNDSQKSSLKLSSQLSEHVPTTSLRSQVAKASVSLPMRRASVFGPTNISRARTLVRGVPSTGHSNSSDDRRNIPPLPEKNK